MNNREYQQIELIAEQVNELSKRSFADKLKAIYADHSMHGRLQSGATIRVAMKSMAELANNSLTELIGKVSCVSNDLQAFRLMSAEIDKLLRNLMSEIPGIVKMAGGHVSAKKAADDLFNQIRSDIQSQLAISEFQFGQPSNFADQQILRNTNLQPQKLTIVKNHGGKPLAAHWDEMWATLAVAIYTGDLQPKTQADIETAIKNWFSENNLDIGDTAARDRARTLWKKYQAAE